MEQQGIIQYFKKKKKQTKAVNSDSHRGGSCAASLCCPVSNNNSLLMCLSSSFKQFTFSLVRWDRLVSRPRPPPETGSRSYHEGALFVTGSEIIARLTDSGALTYRWGPPRFPVYGLPVPALISRSEEGKDLPH